MFDRLLRFAVSRVATLVVLAFGAYLAVELLHSQPPTVDLPAPAAGHGLGGIGAAILVVLFSVGLVVRGAQFVANLDPRRAKERATRDRAVRQRVRCPAEGVPPVESRAEMLEDPDLAIGDEECD